MNYAEEKEMDVDTWTPEEFENYQFSYKDKVIANKLLFEKFKSEEEFQSGLHRLAQIAAVSGSVPARAALAQYGGIDLRNTDLFVSVVNSDVSEIPIDFEMAVLRIARERKSEGDTKRHLALNAVLGAYPPEYGDTLPCTDSPTADPYYDSKQTSFSSLNAPMQETHNSG